MTKSPKQRATRSKYVRAGFLLSAVLTALVLAELGIRVCLPRFRLAASQSEFSVRYHHMSPELAVALRRVQAHPAAFQGPSTVAFLGDSFVAGDSIDASRRFTSLLQAEMGNSPTKVLNLGSSSFSTMLYERLYRDVVLPLDPGVVIVCLDQTDAADDYLYEQELSSRPSGNDSAISDALFEDTILSNYESHPMTFFLLRNSRLVLSADTLKRRITGAGFVPASNRLDQRDAEKTRLYLETCRDPRSHPDLFEHSRKYIESIARLKPPQQRLFFVTYPRAENLAGQHKTTLLGGELPDSQASTPYFEYWIDTAHLEAQYPNVTFVHTAADFREAIEASDEQYYSHVGDVHWNAQGHRLFADIMERRIFESLNQTDGNRDR
jgi:lysophospholipase L1-like esterase